MYESPLFDEFKFLNCVSLINTQREIFLGRKNWVCKQIQTFDMEINRYKYVKLIAQ